MADPDYQFLCDFCDNNYLISNPNHDRHLKIGCLAKGMGMSKLVLLSQDGKVSEDNGLTYRDIKKDEYIYTSLDTIKEQIELRIKFRPYEWSLDQEASLISSINLINKKIDRHNEIINGSFIYKISEFFHSIFGKSLIVNKISISKTEKDLIKRIKDNAGEDQIYHLLTTLNNYPGCVEQMPLNIMKAIINSAEGVEKQFTYIQKSVFKQVYSKYISKFIESANLPSDWKIKFDSDNPDDFFKSLIQKYRYNDVTLDDEMVDFLSKFIFDPAKIETFDDLTTNNVIKLRLRIKKNDKKLEFLSKLQNADLLKTSFSKDKNVIVGSDNEAMTKFSKQHSSEFFWNAMGPTLSREKYYALIELFNLLSTSNNLGNTSARNLLNMENIVYHLNPGNIISLCEKTQLIDTIRTGDDNIVHNLVTALAMAPVISHNAKIVLAKIIDSWLDKSANNLTNDDKKNLLTILHKIGFR